MLLANALLGNNPECEVFEIPMMGGLFECTEQGTVSVVGASANMTVNGVVTPNQSRFSMKPGALLEIGPSLGGIRSYLAESTRSLATARLAQAPGSLAGGPLRFVAGPQADCFDLASFQRTEFKVSPQSDRRGLRLFGQCEGTVQELPSEPSCMGVVQVTPSGEPIILGPDGPTIGGYPKIGVVISADLDRVGQLAPGAPVVFELVSAATAAELFLGREERIARAVRDIGLANL
jgi:allophanate hydrolase subunit 2